MRTIHLALPVAMAFGLGGCVSAPTKGTQGSAPVAPVSPAQANGFRKHVVPLANGTVASLVANSDLCSMQIHDKAGKETLTATWRFAAGTVGISKQSRVMATVSVSDYAVTLADGVAQSGFKMTPDFRAQSAELAKQTMEVCRNEAKAAGSAPKPPLRPTESKGSLPKPNGPVR